MPKTKMKIVVEHVRTCEHCDGRYWIDAGEDEYGRFRSTQCKYCLWGMDIERREIDVKDGTLMKCSNASRYKGKKRPACNGGVGCVSCWHKWHRNKQ